MLLSELLQPLFAYQCNENADVAVLDIQTNSRRVHPGSLFVAVPGHTVDGHDFAPSAVESGAVALLVERRIPDLTVPQVVVPDTRRAAALLADVLYGHPSHKLRMIGVTGTNGKTTVTHIIAHVLETAGKQTGLLGTVGGRIGAETFPLQNTTPEAVDVHGYLQRMVDAGCSHGVMEVSSHALVERRVAGVDYKIAVFTNLTQDHLDFHKTMEDYAQAKRLLFARLGNLYASTRENNTYAIVNQDDPYRDVMLDATVAQSLTYGCSAGADVRAEHIRLTHNGTMMDVLTPWGHMEVTTSLIGRFNVYNVLAAIAVGIVEQIPFDVMREALQSYPGVPGRCERVDAGQPFGIFVDYAHTPDGLENVLTSVREFASGDVITVVGCGGDRDKTKRPLMAAIAMQHSDFAIFTSDNPRTEDEVAILDDMVQGIPPGADHYLRCTDRREAIYAAVGRAKPGDVVVIAGKGHEDYQIIGRTKVHFDDRQEARAAVQARGTTTEQV